MEHQEFAREFEAEVHRLNLDMFRFPGLKVRGTPWEAPALERMRSLQPGATWADVFPDLELLEPDPGPDRESEQFWRKLEFLRELRRVVSAPGASSEGMGGITLPHGPEHALRVLRELPDGAGWRALEAALASRPADD